jgi:hypothetical protein
MSKDQPKRILILGGGFAGLYAAMELEINLSPPHRRGSSSWLPACARMTGRGDSQKGKANDGHAMPIDCVLSKTSTVKKA